MEHNKSTIYQMVTNRIIASLEQGVIPWKQPWDSTGIPRNLITDRPYRGINAFVLHSLQFTSNYFLSFKQVNQLGGSVKKGEKSCPVVFWKWFELEDEVTKEVTKKWLLRYYNVFNLDQCENIPERFIPKPIERENTPIKRCREIIKGMADMPKLVSSKDGAYYIPPNDTIHIPGIKAFKNSESYYLTLFHELVHSTGHEKRLARPEIMEHHQFGSEPYSLEELTAEMGACFLASASGILDMEFENNAAYIKGWLDVFQGDTKFLFKAGSQAQKSVDYILGTTPIYADETPTETETVV